MDIVDLVRPALLVVLAGALVAAAAFDLSRYLIPNRFPAVIAASFVASAPFVPFGEWLAGAATGLVVLFGGVILFARGMLGGGDVKLLAASALFAGPTLLMPFLLVTTLTGAVLACCLLTPLARLMPAPPGSTAPALRRPIPYGLAIAAGGLFIAGTQITS